MFGSIVDVTKAEIDKLDQLRCIDEANKSKIVRELDAKVSDLNLNWQPTGFYTPAQIERLVQQVISVFPQVKVALATAPRSTSTADADIGNAILALDTRAKTGYAYLEAAQKAKQSGGVVDAPGLKKWVLFGMNDIAHAYTVVAVLQCRVTWIETALGAIVAIWNTARAITGALVDAGVAVVEAADDVWKARRYIKWGFIGLGALILGGFAVHWARSFRKALPPSSPSS